MSKRTRKRPSVPYYGKVWKQAAKSQANWVAQLTKEEDEAYLKLICKEFGIEYKPYTESMLIPKVPSKREIGRQWRAHQKSSPRYGDN